MKELWDKLDGNSDKSHGLTMLHLPSRLPTVKHLGLFIILYLYHAPTQSVKARNVRKLWTLEDLQRQIPFKDFRMECRFGMIWVLLDSGMLRLPKAKASWSMLTLHHPMRYKRNQNNSSGFQYMPTNTTFVYKVQFRYAISKIQALMEQPNASAEHLLGVSMPHCVYPTFIVFTLFHVLHELTRASAQSQFIRVRL